MEALTGLVDDTGVLTPTPLVVLLQPITIASSALSTAETPRRAQRCTVT
jgi:hypothetical protein